MYIYSGTRKIDLGNKNSTSRKRVIVYVEKVFLQ